MMGSFADQVARFNDKTQDKMTRAVQKITLDAFSEVIMRSPVDTGRFRGNWLPAIGAIPGGTLEVEDKAGAVATGRVRTTVADMGIGKIAYLANNLPYAQRLEDGWSKQAPAGMVRLTAQRFQAIANAVFVQIGRE